MTSSFLKANNDWDIIIPNTREGDGITWFAINVRIGNVKWSLEHRYREFSDLHKALVSNHSVSKELLPPKVFFKKMTQDILEGRREGLQTYLNSVVQFLSNTMPPVLVTFLEFDRYDMWFIFHNLASCIRGNNWIDNPPEELRINIVEVSALSDRLKLPCPPASIIGSQAEFCTVLEFITSVKSIVITGEEKDYVGDSNIPYGNIPFELSAFRCLEAIGFSKVYLGNLKKADDVRTLVKSLKANHCKLTSIYEILLCDNIHKNCEQISSTGQVWKALKMVDLSHNSITEIDSGLELLPHTSDFNACFNLITSLNNISKLHNLRSLKLSHNRINSLDGNISLTGLLHLDLSNNELVHINNIIQFPALETLNLSFNRLENFKELDHVSSLTNILNVDLVGNPLSQKTDYRVKVLGKFGKRAPLVCLDNEQCTAHELELIALVQALKFVEEGKSLSFNKNLSLNM